MKLRTLSGPEVYLAMSHSFCLVATWCCCSNLRIQISHCQVLSISSGLNVPFPCIYPRLHDTLNSFSHQPSETKSHDEPSPALCQETLQTASVDAQLAMGQNLCIMVNRSKTDIPSIGILAKEVGQFSPLKSCQIFSKLGK